MKAATAWPTVTVPGSVSADALPGRSRAAEKTARPAGGTARLVETATETGALFPDQRKGQQGQEGQQGRPAERGLWDAADLVGARFPEPRWAVPGLVSEGLTLLVGPPKVGKSWLSLGLAVAVASGGRALDRIEVDPGHVLYLALEDTERRLQARLRKVIGPNQPPRGLSLGFRWPTVTTGGAEMLAEWLADNPATRLVIIDVFARVRGAAAPYMSAYAADYEPLACLKAVADAHGVALVVVHHVRKAKSEDFLEDVSGTNGLAGAADTVMSLRRQRGDASGVLHVTGRDVDEAEHPLTFDAEGGRWSLLDGAASEYALADTRRAIFGYVRDHDGARPKEIAEGLNLDAGLVRKTCARMLADGQLDSPGHGRYRVPVPAVPSVSVPGQ